MQTEPINQRRTHRFNVSDLGYLASISIGKNKTCDCTVLDFSAAGIQVDAPLDVDIPAEGTLHYNGQDFYYVVRREQLSETSKQLGLEISGLPPERKYRLKRNSIGGSDKSTTGRGIFGASLWDISFWVIASTGLCLVWALVFRGSSGFDYRDVDGFWRQMAGQKKDSSPSFNLANRLSLPNSTQAGSTRSPKEKKQGSSFTQGANMAIAATGLYNSVTSPLSQASELLNRADYSAAIRVCSTAISQNQSLTEAWHLRGVALNRVARNAEAIGDLRHALSLDPQAPLIYADLAQALYDVGKFDEAGDIILRGFELAGRDLRPRLRQLAVKIYDAKATGLPKDLN